MNETYQLINWKDIQIDPKMQTREVKPEWARHLAELIERGETLPPLLVGRVGKYNYLLGGFNRLEAWKKHLPDGGDVQVRVEEFPSAAAMFEAAILDNRTHGNPYTDRERQALYYRLTREMKLSHKKARDILGLSDSHTIKWDEMKIITYGEEKKERATLREQPSRPERASRYEHPVSHERANWSENPTLDERVGEPENPMRIDRASKREQPIPDERARMSEQPSKIERAKQLEQPTKPERARSTEQPNILERATDGEKPRLRERATYKEQPTYTERPTPAPPVNPHEIQSAVMFSINFHAEKLAHYIRSAKGKKFPASDRERYINLIKIIQEACND